MSRISSVSKVGIRCSFSLLEYLINSYDLVWRIVELIAANLSKHAGSCNVHRSLVDYCTVLILPLLLFLESWVVISLGFPWGLAVAVLLGFSVVSEFCMYKLYLYIKT